MYYYRHAFQGNMSGSDDFAVNFYPTLSSLGFSGTSGEDISTWTNGPDNTTRSFKWRADDQTINTYFSEMRHGPGSQTWNSFTFVSSYGSTASGGTIFLDLWGTGSTLGMTFIPLKNSSFFWNVYNCGYAAVAPIIYLFRNKENATLDVPTPPALPISSLSFLCIQPIIYNIDNYNSYWYFTRGNTLASGTSEADIYGRLPSSQGLSNWSLYNINRGFYDFGQGAIPIVIDGMTNIIDKTTNYQASNYNKTNVNANTCVLVKMPYNSSFCENVFLMTTAPQEIKPASFFSFNGRNFMNVWDNLVVELPNN